jgi:hypothetical protein
MTRVRSKLNHARRTVLALEDRLQRAFAKGYQITLLYFDSPEQMKEVMGRVAYSRDKVISGLLQLHFANAVANNDRDEIERLKNIWKLWHWRDKGPRWKSREFVEALDLLRRIHAHNLLTRAHPELLEVETLRDLVGPLATTNSHRFDQELARAKAFRAERSRNEGSVALTEEVNLRADLTFLGIGCVLYRKTDIGYTEDLMQKYAPDWNGDKKNFQKLLDECLVPWTRRKPGRPVRSEKRGTQTCQK